MNNLKSLEAQLTTELTETRDELLALSTGDAEERVNEIADSYVPIYYYQLFEVATHDTHLATEEPEGYGGDMNAIAFITANISHHLQTLAYEWLWVQIELNKHA